MSREDLDLDKMKKLYCKDCGFEMKIKGVEKGYNIYECSNPYCNLQDKRKKPIFFKISSHLKALGLIIFISLIVLYSSFFVSAAFDYQQAGILSHYNFDEGVGTTANDNADGHPLTTSNSWTPYGLINSAYVPSSNNIDSGINLAPYNNFSISIWINKTGVWSDYDMIFGTGSSANANAATFYVNVMSSGQIQLNFYGGTANTLNCPVISDTKYHHVVVAFTGLNQTIYCDGVPTQSANLVANNFSTNSLRYFFSNGGNNLKNSFIDELSTFTTTLNSSQVFQLYNGGAGVAFTNDQIFTNIISPNQTNILVSGANFTANSTLRTSTGKMFNNITYYFYNFTNSIFNITTFRLSGNGTNITSKFFGGFGNLTAYRWSVISCANDSVDVICASSENATFTAREFQENSFTFNNFTTSGAYENFTFNFTFLSTVTSAFFTYNNTIYPTSISFDGEGNIILKSAINVPTVTSSSIKSFFWTINDVDGQFNSTINNQTINALPIDDCTVNPNKILNLTLYDEETQNIIPITSALNGTIEVTVTIYPTNQYPNQNFIVSNFSKTYSITNNASVCIDNINTSQYYMDAQIRFSANTYVTKLYNIQKYLLTSNTYLQNIALLDLPSSLNTDFAITIKDSSFLNIPNALIIIQRKYIGSGNYRAVEIPLSDNFGQALGHFNRNSVVYRISIVQNNVSLFTVNDISIICQDPLTTQCVLNLNQAEGSLGFSNLQTYGNLAYSLTFTPSTRTVLLNFMTTDGSSANMVLNVTGYPSFNSSLICTNSIVSAGGSLSCVIPSGQTGGIVANVYKDGEFVTSGIYTLPSTSVVVRDAYLYVLVLIITLPLLFIDNYIVFGFGLIVGLASAIMLNLYQQTSWLGVTSSMTWLAILVFVVMYKLSHRNREGGVY